MAYFGANASMAFTETGKRAEGRINADVSLVTGLQHVATRMKADLNAHVKLVTRAMAFHVQ